MLVGGAGSDLLHGGEGFDTVSYGDSDRGIVADVTTGQVAQGDDVDRLVDVERIVGSRGDDRFAFSAPQANAVYRVVGGQGTNSLDLTQFDRDQVEVRAGQLVVTLDSGETFTIAHRDIDQVLLADGELRNINVPQTSLVALAGRTSVTSPVLDRAFDLDGDELRVDSFAQPANGRVELLPDGRFSYTPNAGFFGADRVTYTVVDDNGNAVTATVDILVPAPIAGVDFPATDSTTGSGGATSEGESSDATNGRTADGSANSNSDDNTIRTEQVVGSSLAAVEQLLAEEAGDLPPGEPTPLAANGPIGLTPASLEDLDADLQPLAAVQELAGNLGLQDLDTLGAEAQLDGASDLEANLDGELQVAGAESRTGLLQGAFAAVGGLLMGLVGLRKPKDDDQKRATPDQVGLREEKRRK
ncbi:MAG: cadherin-like domain-containing protein [Pirellulaceae bacterium]